MFGQDVLGEGFVEKAENLVNQRPLATGQRAAIDALNIVDSGSDVPSGHIGLSYCSLVTVAPILHYRSKG
jgi:hypothetical protein